MNLVSVTLQKTSLEQTCCGCAGEREYRMACNKVGRPSSLPEERSNLAEDRLAHQRDQRSQRDDALPIHRVGGREVGGSYGPQSESGRLVREHNYHGRRVWEHQHAVEAAEVLRKALTLANVQAFARHRSQAKEIEEHIHSVLDAPFWIAKSQVSEMCTFLRLRTKETLQDWPVYAKEAGALDYLSGEEVRTLQLINDPQSTIKERVDSHNQRFLREELIARGSFFDTIEKNPLTDEQRVAAITFDDNVLTIAAAGSGKTSTLVAKAGYAITAGIAEPAQILLLAFNKDAADELKERVQQYLSKHISNASEYRGKYLSRLRALGHWRSYREETARCTLDRPRQGP